MTDHVTSGERLAAREHAAHEMERVLQQEMMARRFMINPPHCPRLQSGVLLVFIGMLMLLVLQQVLATDPAVQVAQQRRVGPEATRAINGHIHPVLERNDP
jgi:hypothetical protein